jgi:peptidoglycan/LPS O-acetylase OafA/YrhL
MKQLASHTNVDDQKQFQILRRVLLDDHLRRETCEMPLLEKLRYRPEVDGLRAIAVLAVVLFHAGFGCSGGFVGVDIFFVISGYLITKLIWFDLENGHFTFAHFWERRARRILPAFLVVTISTVAAGWFYLLPSDFRSLGRATASQALFAANIHYWLDSGYFATASEEKPLLHTWSLAVEEQFYFIVPFLLLTVYQMHRFRCRKGIVFLLGLGSVLSFCTSLYGVSYYPSAAFYFLPTRAWEMLFGSLAAFMPNASVVLPKTRWHREVISLASLTLIVVSIAFYTESTPFPGIAALLPCSGAAFLIWVSQRSETMTPTIVSKCLSWRPLVFVGLISYSLYLWHWPLLAFARYMSPVALSVGQRLTLCGIGTVLAIVSWKYVEGPFRNRSLATSGRSMLLFAGLGLVTIWTVGLTVYLNSGFPQRVPPHWQEMIEVSSDISFNQQQTAVDIRSGRFLRIGVTDESIIPSLFVWGDSHAMAAMPAFDSLLKESGGSGLGATYSSTAPILKWYKVTPWGLGKDAVEFNDAIFDYLKEHPIKDVFMVAFWSAYQDEKGAFSVSFNDGLLKTVRELHALGCRPWIVLDVPNHSIDIPRALLRSAVLHEGSQGDLTSLCSKPESVQENDGMDKRLIAEIINSGGRVIDPKPIFLDKQSRYYVVQSEGVPLYRDKQHLTVKGARLVLLPWLRAVLGQHNSP